MTRNRWPRDKPARFQEFIGIEKERLWLPCGEGGLPQFENELAGCSGRPAFSKGAPLAHAQRCAHPIDWLRLASEASISFGHWAIDHVPSYSNQKRRRLRKPAEPRRGGAISGPSILRSGKGVDEGRGHKSNLLHDPIILGQMYEWLTTEIRSV